MWRHDAPGQARTPGNALTSCLGSLEIVDLPQFGRQLELDETTDPGTTPAAPAAPGDDPMGSVPLFEVDPLI